MTVVADVGCESSVNTKTCTPGAMQACACVDGAKGAQTCQQDGVAFAPCVCSSSGTSGGGFAGASSTGSMGCTPGEQVACTCNDGSSGAQVCNGSETFDPCVCTSSSTTGMGGMGGSSGQGGSGACLSDLSNVGDGDFRIALKLQTTQSGMVAVVNQRTPAC